jgi:hypothetical protein
MAGAPQEGGDVFDPGDGALGSEDTPASDLSVALRPTQHPAPDEQQLRTVRAVLRAKYGDLAADTWISDDCVERYVRAEKGNTDVAAERIAATVSWRRETQPEHVECTECLNNHRSHDARSAPAQEEYLQLIVLRLATAAQIRIMLLDLSILTVADRGRLPGLLASTGTVDRVFTVVLQPQRRVSQRRSYRTSSCYWNIVLGGWTLPRLSCG